MEAEQLLIYKSSFIKILTRVSFTKVDLPEPLTPVIKVNVPSGIFRSTFIRLLPLAPFKN